jgi:uncharacterized membrane protein YidH (DUF202 family)
MIPSLFRRILPRPIANTGSELRDHLANERTFLSWTRMGLTFAAMALALSRLTIIDHIFNPQWSTESTQPTPKGWQFAIKSISPSSERDTGTYGTKSQPRYMNDLVASQICQAISIWSLGNGIFRYLSIRKNLLQGRFVPAIWGPILVTCSTLGVLGTILQKDRVQCRMSPIMQKQNSD